MIDNIRFQKNEEYIEVKDGTYLINLDMSTTQIEDAILIDLPSLEIRTSASKKNKIDQEIHDSILSFFNDEIKAQGEGLFIDRMKCLGFVIKPITSVIEPTVLAKSFSAEKEHSDRRSTI